MSQYGAARLRYSATVPCDTTQERCVTRTTARATQREARAVGVVSRHDSLCCDRGAATRCASTRVRVATRQGMACYTAGHDHDTAPRRHDTGLYAPQHGAQRALCALPGHSARCLGAVSVQYARSLGVGCASCAPNPVLSHCLNHCS